MCSLPIECVLLSIPCAESASANAETVTVIYPTPVAHGKKGLSIMTTHIDPNEMCKEHNESKDMHRETLSKGMYRETLLRRAGSNNDVVSVRNASPELSGRPIWSGGREGEKGGGGGGAGGGGGGGRGGHGGAAGKERGAGGWGNGDRGEKFWGGGGRGGGGVV